MNKTEFLEKAVGITKEPEVATYQYDDIDVTEFFEESPPLDELVSSDVADKLLEAESKLTE